MRHRTTSLAVAGYLAIGLVLTGATATTVLKASDARALHMPSGIQRLLMPNGFVNAAQSPAAGSGAQNALTPAEAAAGWILLFDGRTLTGWTPDSTSTADWKVEDGTITFYTGRGMLRHGQNFKDFELKVDFWGEKTANSGVMIRCTPTDKGGQACYEVNIYDPSPTAPTGSINAVYKIPFVPNTAEKWNTFEITAKGPRMLVKMNGEQIVDTEDPKLTTGTLGVQASGPDGPGRIKFRNMKIRPIN